MSVLLLRLTGPLQSWGERSRYARRESGAEPSKSGIVGLLAAALGRQRTDAIEDLAGLSFGVRIDQAGTLLRDFQTARSLDGARSMPLSTRYYLTDARFLAAVEGPDEVIETLAAALQNPTYPLYLGRRSCPPSEPIARQDCVRTGPLLTVLLDEPWSATKSHRRSLPDPARLSIAVDAVAADVPPDVARRFIDREVPQIVRDHPVSFDPRARTYGLRSVVRGAVEVENPGGRESLVSSGAPAHSPMDELGSW